MLVTNYPNYKEQNQQQHFEFKEISNPKKPSSASSKKKKIGSKLTLSKTPSLSQTRQNFNNISKKQNAQTPNYKSQYSQSIMSKTLGSSMHRPKGMRQKAETELLQQQDENCGELRESQMYEDYDEDEAIRKAQIREEWQKMVDERITEEQINESKKIQEQKEYEELVKEVKQLRKYKQWSEQVYLNSSSNAEYKQIKNKLENLLHTQEREEKQYEENCQRIEKLQDEYQRLYQYNQNKKTDLQNITEKNKQQQRKIQSNKEQTQKKQRNIQVFQQNLQELHDKTQDYFSRKNNKGKVKKSEVDELLKLSLQQFTAAQKQLK